MVCTLLFEQYFQEAVLTEKALENPLIICSTAAKAPPQEAQDPTGDPSQWIQKFFAFQSFQIYILNIINKLLY